MSVTPRHSTRGVIGPFGEAGRPWPLNAARGLARRLGGDAPHVVVAGAHCLVGRHLVRHLAAGGCRVTIVDLPLEGRGVGGGQWAPAERPRVVWHDLSVPLHIDDPVDAVVDLTMVRAAVDRDETHVLRAAADATRHALDVALRHDAVYLLGTTSDVYGGCRQAPRHEDDLGGTYRAGSLAVRQRAHRLAEATVASADELRGADVRVARLFNVYGPPSGPANDVVTRLLGQALRGEPLTVHSDGSQTRTFLHVDDATEALIRMLRPGLALPGAVNIGGAAPISIVALARTVRRITGSSSTIRRCPEPDDTVRHRHPDISRASRHLAWRPRTALVAGLTRTINDAGVSDCAAGSGYRFDRAAQRVSGEPR